MDELSDLDRLLLEQVEEARLHSAGSFTISGEKALEKLAAFQLPRETAWASKLVQAAVVGGARSLIVRQNNSENVFVFEKPSLTWTVNQVEAAFYDPQVTTDSALDHFKRGLWPVSIRDMRPFRLVLPGASEILFWDGERLRRRPGAPAKNLELSVSNRNRHSGPLNLLSPWDGTQINREVRKELRENCFTCPIPLSLNEQRLDALQGCPLHGFSPTSYPMRVGLSEAELPELPVPKLTAEGYKPVNPGESKLNDVFHPKVDTPNRVNVGVLVAITLEPTTMGEASMPIPLRRPCAINWVRDGIVIKREQLDMPLLAVSAGLFVSAEGLETDLTGFEPVKGPELERRQKLACRAATIRVKAAQFSSASYIRGVLKRAYTLGGLIMGAGLLAAYSSVDPISGYLIAGGGAFGNVAVTLAVNFSAERTLERALQNELKRLKAEWHHRWG